jgi:hypothetical protein
MQDISPTLIQKMKPTFISVRTTKWRTTSIRKKKELGGKLHSYKADVVGEFKETQYPNDEVLELKVGAQIMFIRNDTSADKKYYNGKLAKFLISMKMKSL